MAAVRDKVGREFQFERIRFNMDEELLQQAGREVVDETSDRAQLVFERYCRLHLMKYKRNFEPTHFAGGRLIARFLPLYESPRRSIRVTIEVTEGPLFDRFIGQPPDYIEQSVRLDPRAWVSAGTLVSEQT